MIGSIPPFFRQSSSFLRNLLIGFWIGGATLSSIALVTIDLVERHREVVYDADHLRDVISATLTAPIDTKERQIILRAYISTPREEELDGLNHALVINEQGKIVYSSIPNWIGMSIADPILSRRETNDPDFQALAACFRRSEEDCINFKSSDFQVRLGSFTVIRPLRIPSRDMGISSERLLVVANYDPGVVLADFSQDVMIVLLVCFGYHGLLTLFLSYLLFARMLPKLVETSRTDSLTQLINRGQFMEQAKDLLAEAEERSGDIVFAILDVDYFKRINDTFGHACGDAALAHVAEIFRTVIRPDDLVCRFGGEEFALLLNGSRQTAGRALERMRLQVEMSRLTFAGHQIKLTASFGAACTKDCGYNIDYLYNMADKALYMAKSSGRNRLEWSDGRAVSRLAR